MTPKEMPETKQDIAWRMQQFFSRSGLKHDPKHGSSKTCANKAHGRNAQRRQKRHATKLARRAQRAA